MRKTIRAAPDSIPAAQVIRRPFAFLWKVPDQGLRLRHDYAPIPAQTDVAPDEGPGPWLVANVANGWRQYAPLDRGDIHRRFARLSSPSAIERFASRYGLLGHSRWGAYTHGGDAPVGVALEGESLARWVREVEAMRDLLKRWAEVRPKPINPNRLQVYEAVNARVRGHFSSVIHPLRGGELLVWPDCLLSALYLLLQREMAGQPAASATCKQCGKVLDNPARPTSKVFCNDNCRVLYHYHHPSPGKKEKKR